MLCIVSSARNAECGVCRIRSRNSQGTLQFRIPTLAEPRLKRYMYVETDAPADEGMLTRMTKVEVEPATDTLLFQIHPKLTKNMRPATTKATRGTASLIGV
jgi:hypothetical protein